MKRLGLLALVLVACGGHPVLKMVPSKTTLRANGYDTAVLKIYGTESAPRIEILGDGKFSRLIAPRLTDGRWDGELQAGVMPGAIRVRVSAHRQHLDQTISLLPQITDSASDGTPDFLRLEEDSDREAFRFWITYLAELQYFIPPEARPSEITDCSSLVRYAYREAMREHDAAWLAGAKLPLIQASQSIQKYSFPHTLLGANIFRTRRGTYSPADLSNDTFRQFADAKTLQECSMFFVSRDMQRAEPGDVLFYRRETVKGVSYHSMVFVGRSRVKPDGKIYVVYHTGPDGSKDGEIRRLTLTQLLRFPNPQWQAIAANPLFLGVYRWNILKALS